jgi:hypothetical protein
MSQAANIPEEEAKFRILDSVDNWCPALTKTAGGDGVRAERTARGGAFFWVL